MVFNDKISVLQNIDISNLKNEYIRRKNITLLKSETRLEIDLNCLDNYYGNIDKIDTSLKNLDVLTQIFGMNCDKITTTTIMPFSQETRDVSEIKIQDLYI